MKRFFKYLLVSFAFIVITNPSYAQKIEMADAMRSNGMIYVVVAILGIVMLGLFSYLILIDRKITKIEKELDL